MFEINNKASVCLEKAVFWGDVPASSPYYEWSQNPAGQYVQLLFRSCASMAMI